MNIDALKSRVKGYARSNLYVVQIVRDEANNPMLENPEELVNFLVKDINIPDISLRESQLEYRGFKVPDFTAVEYGEVTATFLCDVEMEAWAYFKLWLNKYTGKQRKSEGSTASTIRICQMQNNLATEEGLRVILHKAYPKSISSLKFTDEESILEFTVTFGFTNMTGKVKFGEDSPDFMSAISGITGLVGGAIAGIGSVKNILTKLKK